MGNIIGTQKVDWENPKTRTKILTLYRNGNTTVSIAKILGIAPLTLTRNIKRFPEMVERIRAYRLKLDDPNGVPDFNGQRIGIDLVLARKYARNCCSIQEIADAFGVSYNTLKRDDGFMEMYKKERAEINNILRQYQHDVASVGNPTMLVWLGKQYLKQSDKPQEEEDNGTLKELLSAIRDSRTDE